MSKEKQIEEMAEHLIEIQQNFNEYCAKPCRECELGGIVNCENHYKAERLYNAGYRKQSEGEWIAKPQEWYIDATDWMCSNCKTEFSPIDMMGDDFFRMMKFCPECGAKMKGGAE